jgi:hypothetical protein
MKANQEARNGGNGISDIEGKAAKGAARKPGSDRVSKQEGG